MLGKPSSYDSISWECLGGDHPHCNRPSGLCSCNCHKRNRNNDPHKKIMEDIKANSPDMK
jgi:hypothetical protein